MGSDPEMYTVRVVSSDLHSRLIDNKHALSSFVYPRTDTSSREEGAKCVVYDSKLTLYESQGTKRPSFWSALFSEKYSHCVVLTQNARFRQDKGKTEWVLYEANGESNGKEGLEAINRTLAPLLHEGTTFLSEDLLDAIITPTPVSLEDLSTIVIELMEYSPTAHPNWPAVVETVLKAERKPEQPRRGPPPLQRPKSLLFERRKTEYFDTVSGMPKTKEEVYAAAREDRSDSIRKLLVSRASRMSITVEDPEVSIESRTSITSIASSQDDFFDAVDDVSQDTPLYSSVQKGYIKSSFFLLLGGANSNFVHPISGNTCLHLAAEQCSLVLVKLLLVFDADVSIKNANGKTPAEVLPAVPNCEEIKALLAKVKELKKEQAAVPSDPVTEASEDGEYLLSFDGGGARCISEVQVLIAIEKRMMELNPNCHQQFISHFDCIAGTSGGSFHALLLAYNKVSLADDRALNVNAATYLETKSIHEKTKNVERLQRNTLGESRVMTDVTSPKIIVTATLAKTIPPKLHLITNYGEARDGELGPQQRKVWEAARMSSAAPTYFLPFQNFLDGGLMANNPTVDSLVEMNEQSIKNKGHPLKISCVVSLGSGHDALVNVDNIDVSGLSSYGIKGIANTVQSYKNFLAMVIAQVTQTEGQDLLRAKTLCDISGGKYYRLTAPVGKAVPLDTSDLVDLIQPIFDSFMFTLSNPKLIDSVARSLLSNSRLYDYS